MIVSRQNCAVSNFSFDKDLKGYKQEGFTRNSPQFKDIVNQAAVQHGLVYRR